MSEKYPHGDVSTNISASVIPPILEELPSAHISSHAMEPTVESLTELLRDPEGSRIVLYLPCNLLPTPRQHDYREAYLDAWWRALQQPDQRADFLDGDIGERNSDIPRELVIKAAHLAPHLIDKGLLQPDELQYIYKETDSEILKTSIQDAVHPTVFDTPRTTFHSLPGILQTLDAEIKANDVSPSRQKWLYETAIDAATKEIARTIDETTFDHMKVSSDTIEIRIALRALARFGRFGKDISSEVAWVQEQQKSDDSSVRIEAERSLRHLVHSNVAHEDLLHEMYVPHTILSGSLSKNLESSPDELRRLQRIAERLGNDPEYAKTYFPIVLVGGSRLKGYGDASSDIDTTVLTRPGAQADGRKLSELFGNDMPLVLNLTNTPNGIRIAETDETNETWSHLVYSTVWIGEAGHIAFLRRELTSAYDNPSLRHVALRRLEQDSLQYRLMHKGYEKQYPTRSDDIVISPDTMQSQSTFWDDGYRRLATQLFIEKVRLPKIT